MFEEIIPERLALLRLQKNVSARDMSLSIGQNPGYINNIETGKALPSMAGFFFICEFLEVTPQEFFDVESKQPSELKVLIENLKKLTPSQLVHVSAIVNDLVQKSR